MFTTITIIILTRRRNGNTRLRVVNTTRQRKKNTDTKQRRKFDLIQNTVAKGREKMGVGTRVQTFLSL